MKGHFLSNSMFFGVLVSILAYEVGVLLKKEIEICTVKSVTDLHRDHYPDSGGIPY